MPMKTTSIRRWSQVHTWASLICTLFLLLLALTGLTPDALRDGLGDPAVLGAVLEFLASHEPDLLAAAEALGVEPATMMAARERL